MIMMMKINLWLTVTTVILSWSWTISEAVSLNQPRLTLPQSANNKNVNQEIGSQLEKQSNETKPSASFDSFRVSTPESNRDGTLLLDSYHDFRSNHNHHGHHGHHHPHHYGNHHGHHYGHHYGESDYHHRYPHYNYDHHHHRYPDYHHNHHHRHHYPSVDETGSEIANTGEVVDGVDSVDSVDPIEEGVDELAGPVVDGNGATLPIDPATNGELVDPETEEVTETPIDESNLSEEDPIESDVEEIPIEDVPNDSVNGELVSDDLANQPRDYRHHYNGHGYDHRYYDPASSSYDHRHPIYSHLPPTHFKCSHVKHTGYPSDVEARCQVVLPGNRSGRWEILHFLHKSSPLKSNAVIYLDHGGHHHHHHHRHHGHHGYHGLYNHHSHYPHHSGYNHYSHHHRHHYNGHYYPKTTSFIKRRK